MDKYYNIQICKENKAILKANGYTLNGNFITLPRCRDLYLKHFCLEDIVPAILIILIAHIIVAIRWMLIKILSAVINQQGEYKVIVPGGCYLDINIICKPDVKSKMLFNIFLLPACSAHNNIPAAHGNNFQFCQRAGSAFG